MIRYIIDELKIFSADADKEDWKITILTMMSSSWGSNLYIVIFLSICWCLFWGSNFYTKSSVLLWI